jgi:hypothetical protein
VEARKVTTLCLVGHGPSLKGSGLGGAIDGCDFVVRLKNCSMLLAESHDYGRKTDALCTSTETMTNLTKLKAGEYWGYAKKGSFAQARVRRAERYLKARIEIPLEPIQLWNSAFLELGGKHPNVSTGMGALIIALELKKPETVYLAGFDNVCAPMIQGYKSTVPTAWNADGQKDTGHDWFCENKLLGYLQAHYKVPIKDIKKKELLCLQ